MAIVGWPQPECRFLPVVVLVLAGFGTRHVLRDEGEGDAVTGDHLAQIGFRRRPVDLVRLVSEGRLEP